MGNLRITSNDEWVIVLQEVKRIAPNGEIIEQIITTDTELIETLLAMEYSDNFATNFQKSYLRKKSEQYEKLLPVWFDYAPELAKEKRKELENTNNLEKLQWIHDNVSYNPDHSMNIIKLNKTFCEDVSWTSKAYNWEDAKQLAASKWYTLGTDYNDCDSDEVKQNSDWYKVINIFSNGNWDTAGGMKFFRDMAWCDSRYWTATKYKNEKWKESSFVTRKRKLSEYGCNRNWDYTNSICRVCGFKNME